MKKIARIKTDEAKRIENRDMHLMWKIFLYSSAASCSTTCPPTINLALPIAATIRCSGTGKIVMHEKGLMPLTNVNFYKRLNPDANLMCVSTSDDNDGAVDDDDEIDAAKVFIQVAAASSYGLCTFNISFIL